MLPGSTAPPRPYNNSREHCAYPWGSHHPRLYPTPGPTTIVATIPPAPGGSHHSRLCPTPGLTTMVASIVPSHGVSHHPGLHPTQGSTPPQALQQWSRLLAMGGHTTMVAAKTKTRRRIGHEFTTESQTKGRTTKQITDSSKDKTMGDNQEKTR